jgi:uncharacterized protein DUF5681
MSQWEKGQSGNPAGRPPGSKNAQTELRAELQAHGKEILGQLVEKAKTGELVTARFLLRHILPAARSAPIQVPMQLEGSPVQQAEQVKQRLVDGLITLEEAQALLNTTQTVELIRVASELPEKLRELEEKVGFWDEVRQEFQTWQANRENARARLQAVDRAAAAQAEELMPQFHEDLKQELKAQPSAIAEAGLKVLREPWADWTVATMFRQHTGVNMGVLLQRVAEVAPDAAEAVAQRWGLAGKLGKVAQLAGVPPAQAPNGVGSDATEMF